MQEPTIRPHPQWPAYALPRGTNLHGYRLERILGRGAFGITYLALDLVGQRFAIKEFYPSDISVRHDSAVVAASAREADLLADLQRRFVNEARTMVRLTSSVDPGAGIVRAVTCFEANGTCYIVMDYIEGVPLADVLDQHPSGLPPQRLVSFLKQLLHALRVVHAAGLIHRDIKPANIMIGDGDRLTLLDLGASRDLTDDRSHYTVVYSGSYSPPEQMADGQKQGAFSDMYAVGAVLYRAMGGRLVDSITRQTALLAGRPDPLIPASQVADGRYPAEVVAFVQAALTIDPTCRPASVDAILAELTPSSSAAAETVLIARGKGLGPRRTVLAVASVGIGLGAVMWLTDPFRSRSLNPPLPVATTADGPTVAASEARQSQRPRNGGGVSEVWPADLLPESAVPPVPAMRGHIPISPPPPPPPPPNMRGDVARAPTEPRTVRALLDAGYSVRVLGAQPVTSLAIASNERLLITASSDGTARLWDLRTGRQQRVLGDHKSAVTSVAFVPGQSVAVTGSLDSFLRVWATPDGTLVRRIALLGTGVSSLAVSPDGRHALVGDGDGRAVMVALSDGEVQFSIVPERSWPDNRRPVSWVAFSPDGATAAAGGAGSSDFALFDIPRIRGRTPTVRRIDVKSVGAGRMWSAVFSRDSARLYTPTDSTIRVWSVKSGQPEGTLLNWGGFLSLSDDGRHWLAREPTGPTNAVLVDSTTGNTIVTLSGPHIPVVTGAITGDATLGVAASADGMVRVWSLPYGSPFRTLAPVRGGGAIVLSADGLPIAVDGDEDEVYSFVRGTDQRTPSSLRRQGYPLPAPNPVSIADTSEVVSDLTSETLQNTLERLRELQRQRGAKSGP